IRDGHVTGVQTCALPIFFLARSNLLTTQPGIVVAVAVTAVGVGLIAGPWGWRLVQALGDERRERIRSEERAEVAAHLHDSVLQRSEERRVGEGWASRMCE